MAYCLQRTSDGHFQGFCTPCLVCEWHYCRGIDEFYSDMPSLEAGMDFDKPYDSLGLDESYVCMPELESTRIIDCFIGDVHGIVASDVDADHSYRMRRIRDLCTSFFLIQLICDSINLSAPVFTDSLESLTTRIVHWALRLRNYVRRISYVLSGISYVSKNLSVLSEKATLLLRLGKKLRFTGNAWFPTIESSFSLVQIS
ncbi:hypothetical protein M758_UG151400 [Ceratodon purpureus]|nr:hypothetical protein M758_UG151400 [Ceratodon purpureus]